MRIYLIVWSKYDTTHCVNISNELKMVYVFSFVFQTEYS